MSAVAEEDWRIRVADAEADADDVDDADAATAGNDEMDTAAAAPITETSFIVIVVDMVDGDASLASIIALPLPRSWRRSM